MYKEFGHKDQLSADAQQFIEKLLVLMNLSEQEFHCYYKYPTTGPLMESFELSILIVSKLGIWNVSTTAKDQKDFKVYFVPMLLKQDSIYEKDENDKRVYKNYSLDEYNKISCDLVEGEVVLSEKEISVFESTFQNSESLNKPSTRNILNAKSLGAMIKSRSEQINTFSPDQFGYITNNDTSLNFRIRGLAGSGKTIIMCKRLAYLHYHFPTLKLAYVFFTVSLKQTIKNLFEEYYREYSNGGKPNMDNIFLLHGWGSSSNPGFYSLFCNKVGVACEPFDRDDYNRSNFGLVCERAVEACIPENVSMFEHVFIDEAQDFSLPFFKLVLKSLTPNGSISYAYDELQTLSYSVMPNKEKILGDRRCEDINLSICYRTPKKILVTAHAFGMGIYKDEEQNPTSLTNIPEDKSIWRAVGYDSKPPQIRYGQEILFSRSEPFASNLVPEEPIEIQCFEDASEQYTYLYKEITRLIRSEDVLPEDILVIDLSGNQFELNYYYFRDYCVKHQNFGKNIESTRNFETHLLSSEERYYFKKDNSIPYTSIFRAKGNEANIVFVVNSQNMSDIQSYSRNKIFTGMTRARFKVYLLGTKDLQQFVKEYDRVKQNDYMLKFVYPSKDELAQMKKIAISDESAANDISKILELIEKLKGKDNSSAYINVLKEEMQKRIDAVKKQEDNK